MQRQTSRRTILTLQKYKTIVELQNKKMQTSVQNVFVFVFVFVQSTELFRHSCGGIVMLVGDRKGQFAVFGITFERASFVQPLFVAVIG